jgi:CDGSH-type Zn-finger protein
MAHIEVRENGPYVVTGAQVQRRRIVRTSAGGDGVASEDGQSIDWETTAILDAPDTVFLCRCGGSSNKPFCDATHATNGFVADDVATGTYAERSKSLGGDITDDRSVCVHAAFCTSAVTNVWKLAKGDAKAHAQAVEMIDRCPSGALAHAIEPNLAIAVSAVDDGPLWVTGGVPISGLETRNRVTLCRCGHSANKPLCDGAHKEAGFKDS